jgi:Protein of unknown function (DUF2505)
MARRIEHRTGFSQPADRVYLALIDERCLRERLSAIGGRRCELLSYTVGSDTATAVMRQSIDAEHLPGIVRRVTPDGVVIKRTETWRTGRRGDRRSNHPSDYRGAVEASVSGMPGSLRGTTVLSDTADGSELVLDGELTVGIPLIGGRIEDMIAEQLGRLLQAEARFTDRWLRSR